MKIPLKILASSAQASFESQSSVSTPLQEKEENCVHENPFEGHSALKITEIVSFNIASEASYVYILSGQKLIKNAKKAPFWRFFDNLKLAVKQCYQTGQF